jgi:hypothetical protein
MKKVVILISLLLLAGLSHASDVSCQVDVLKPKMNATALQEEVSKPGEITVAEARLRLSKEDKEEQQEQETAQTDNEELPAETAKKESGLGNMFDILIPAKLRNPVRQ